MINWEQTRKRLRASETALERALAVDRGRLEEILRERAAQLASRRNGAAPAEQSLRVLIFRLGKERFALELIHLAEILPLARCASVPGGPPALVGLINVRGEICNVLELATLLSLPEPGSAAEGCVILLRGPRRAVGLRVDEVLRIDAVASQVVQQARQQPVSSASANVRAVLPDGLALLSAETILSHPLLREA
jgi:purine-binding chemotaxis protein CheW